MPTSKDLNVDTICSLEDLPGAMDDGDSAIYLFLARFPEQRFMEEIVHVDCRHADG